MVVVRLSITALSAVATWRRTLAARLIFQPASSFQPRKHHLEQLHRPPASTSNIHHVHRTPPCLPPPSKGRLSRLPRFVLSVFILPLKSLSLPSLHHPRHGLSNLHRRILTLPTGDLPVLAAARARAREAFEQNRTLDSSSPEVIDGVKHAEEVAQFLRANVVQGEKKEGGLYRLRIHDDVERGDNDDIKKKVGSRDIGAAGKGHGTFKCCSEK
jgi:complex III assembly factor LYRM7